MSDLLVFRTHLQHALISVPSLPVPDIPAALLLLESSFISLRSALHAHALPKTSSIHTLPSELLLSIISQVVPHNPAYYHRLLRLSTVCSSWRSLVLSSPSLWTRLSSFTFSSLPRTEALLRFSEHALLQSTIDLRPRSPDLPEAAALALVQLHRTRKLSLTAPPNALSLLFSPLPNDLKVLPHLEIVNLSNHSVTSSPLPLAHLPAPGLRCLALSDFEASFTSPLFKSLRRLTSLELSRSFVRADDVPDLPALLDVLRNSPGLQVLVLRNVLPQSEDPNAVKASSDQSLGTGGMPTGGSDSETRVRLPALKRVELEDLQAPLGALLSNLDVPSGAEYSVQALASAGDDESFEGLLPALVERVRGVDVGKVQVLLDGRALRVRLFDSSSASNSGGRAETELKLIWRGIDESRPARIVRDVLAALPMQNAEDLTLADVEMDEPAWSALLRAVGGVRSVRAEAGALGGLFDALGSYASSIAENEGVDGRRKEKLLAPNLGTLTLARASFTDGAVLRSFVSFVRQWRAARAAAVVAQGSIDSAEPSWEVAPAAEAGKEERTWHRDLEAIDLDRCGFVSEEQIEALKEAGMVLAGL